MEVFYVKKNEKTGNPVLLAVAADTEEEARNQLGVSNPGDVTTEGASADPMFRSIAFKFPGVVFEKAFIQYNPQWIPLAEPGEYVGTQHFVLPPRNKENDLGCSDLVLVRYSGCNCGVVGSYLALGSYNYRDSTWRVAGVAGPVMAMEWWTLPEGAGHPCGASLAPV